MIITTSAITFSGLGIARLGDFVNDEDASTLISSSVLSGPFTFTSPAVYLAHHAVTSIRSSFFASNSFGMLPISSSTRPAGIVALDPSDVYSIRPKYDNHDFNVSAQRLVRRVRHGPLDIPRDERGNELKDVEILPFNYGDLQNPVPARLYYELRKDCIGIQTHCGTITDDTYRPKLAFENRVWLSLFPDAFECGTIA
ncbi:hypothetical protein EJ08DRAFT_226180 [Tothia fuscella]|uniref:Uncharacterized protein n=1 Tax=Tothia fuscella TaxID=1048955 RepID=A0A9P4U4I7_9PEZI|nr:hypothetical protein EJ08DRAFT_226180 [Tothia fuscella]